MTVPTPRRPVMVGMPNFREVAQYHGQDGRRIKAGALYRSGALTGLTKEDWSRFGALGIGLFVDLRSAAERDGHPVPWPAPRPSILPLQVLPDFRASGTTVIGGLVADRDGSQTRALLIGNYASMPAHFGKSLPQLVAAMLSNPAPASVIACTAGQDRTGFVISLLLALAGVDKAAITQDYMISLEHHDAQRINAFVAKTLGVADAELSAATLEALAVSSDYLEAAWGALVAEYRSVSDYFRAHGVSEGDLTHLRNLLLE